MKKRFRTIAGYTKQSRLEIVVAIIVICLAFVNITTVLIPEGTAIWILNLPIIMFSLFTLKPKAPVILAAICAAMIIVDYIYIEGNPIYAEGFLRRSIGAFAYTVAALITRYAILANLKEKELRQKLEIATEELTKEKAKLERSNRELEQFAGVAAHDLRSPVAAIVSWADMLNILVPSPRTPEQEQAISIIKNNAQKASDTIEDILEIARVNVSISHVEQVDLNRLLNDVLLTLEKDIHALDAIIEVAPLPIVQGNQTYLTSIFGNLIRNALTYHDKSRPPQIAIGYIERPDNFEFYVKDNGIGIAPQFSVRIFEMFKRLNIEKDYPGTGIGLAFCKKVIELSGGRIWVNSLLGQGSTFKFTYPKTWLKGSRA